MSSQWRAGGGLPGTLGLASVLAEALSGWLDPPGNVSKVPPWHRNAKGSGKTGKGPNKEPPSNGKGYGRKGQRRREEWQCTYCQTLNFTERGDCRACAQTRAHGAAVVKDGGKSYAQAVIDPGPHRRAPATRPVDGASAAPQASTHPHRADTGGGAPTQSPTGVPVQPRFSGRKLRRAAALLEAAGLADPMLMEKVDAVTRPEHTEAPARSPNVGAKLDKARARVTALLARRDTATQAVAAAKRNLTTVRADVAAAEELVRALELQVHEGEHAPHVRQAATTLQALNELLDTVPDQLQFAFQARQLLLRASENAPRGSDNEEGSAEHHVTASEIDDDELASGDLASAMSEADVDRGDAGAKRPAPWHTVRRGRRCGSDRGGKGRDNLASSDEPKPRERSPRHTLAGKGTTATRGRTDTSNA